MLVREVSELLRSIDSPSISNPNENKSESLLVWPVIVVFYLCSGRHSYTHAIASTTCLGSGRRQADTYDRRKKDPYFIAPREGKFDRGLERKGGRKGSGWI
ncbi:hypothetical protein RND81_13G068800 [Saponaria officinalis]|uniref:Uncharacterized protein n=1 Tax=Saponaria officinalis TaxID=3572 RepID=A0AAW1GUS6_SAPOF